MQTTNSVSAETGPNCTIHNDGSTRLRLQCHKTYWSIFEEVGVIRSINPKTDRQSNRACLLNGQTIIQPVKSIHNDQHDNVWRIDTKSPFDRKRYPRSAYQHVERRKSSVGWIEDSIIIMTALSDPVPGKAQAREIVGTELKIECSWARWYN